MKLYVGNLSYQATDEDLKQAFEQFGTVVSANIISDKYTGNSKGFGFVEMGSKEEGQAAIEGLNGQDLKGRPLKVNEAKPREDRPRFGGGGNRGGFNRDHGNRF